MLPQSKNTKPDLTRRQFLTATGTVALASSLASGVKASAQQVTEFPWPYQVLDPDLVATRAYTAYYSGKGCMYGAFEGLIGELRQTVGAPYTTFPTAMMEYGKGGVTGIWGTLCGSLNGAAAAVNLVSSSPTAVINEIFFWYSQAPLPTYIPEIPKYDLVQSVSGSPICHVSVQNWCGVSGFKPTSPERTERCACLTASVAKCTAQLLNQQAGGNFLAAHQRTTEAQQCMTCHGPALKNNVHHGANMNCTPCHSGIDGLHPQPHITMRWTGKKGTLESADAVTGPWTPAASQSNPQPVQSPDSAKFFRLK